MRVLSPASSSSATMPLFLQDLLPLRSVIVTLRFLGTTSIDFFHHVQLSAYIRTLLGSPEDYEQYFVIDAPESGRTHYSPGDHYRFQIIVLDGGEPLLDDLLTALYQLPQSAIGKLDANTKPFGTNLILDSVVDAFTGYQVESWLDCSVYDNQHLTEEALLWQQHSGCSLHWLSRVRLSKGKSEKKLRGEARYCHDGGDITPSLLFSRLYDAAKNVIQSRGGEVSPRPPSPDVEIRHSHQFWIDYQYGQGRDDKPTKPMGGILGQVELQFPVAMDLSWWRLLILGQYIGIGQNRSFGLGRYQLINHQQGYSYRRLYPARPLLDKVKSEANLSAAVSHVIKHSRQQDELEPDSNSELLESEQFSAYEPPSDIDVESSLATLTQHVNKIEQGRYKTPLLTGWLIKKKSGGVRPLAVPPFWDRVLQRAVSQALSPALEKIMYPSSYGYRKGRSRISAKDEISQWVRKGYKWVFESDLKDFFDSVEHSHLEARLRALYGNDPLVTQLLLWMSADVQFQGEVIARQRGLPQGSPLSPLLANLMLDDFDHDMQSHGFKLVRFADDFIVMCRSPEQARLAERHARQSLAEHGLSLNEDKTFIKPMEQGLRYLGYLFVNDLVLDVGSSNLDDITIAVTQKSDEQKSAEKEKQQLPQNSWLNRIAEQKLHAVKETMSESQLSEFASPQPVSPKQLIGECDNSGEVICISGMMALLSTAQNRLQVKRDDELVHSVPWRHLQALLIIGNHHITTPALKAALANNVAVHFADGMGRYQGVGWNGRGTLGHELWLSQQRCFTETDGALAAAKSLINVKVAQCVKVLRNRRLTVPAAMRSAQQRINQATDLQQLNGFEGAAAAAYFNLLSNSLDSKWQCEGRNRRPPQDPFNVLLSLGYTLLHGYIDSLLKVQGLLPTQGFYHQPHGTHAGLASDLIEPFRHWVDRKAIEMLNKNSLSIDDFEFTDHGCRMSKEARNKYLAALGQEFEMPKSYAAFEQPKRLTDLIMVQNERLKGWIESGEPFEALNP